MALSANHEIIRPKSKFSGLQKRQVSKIETRLPEKFRLVDVENMCIYVPSERIPTWGHIVAPGDDLPPDGVNFTYVSLSYVWGRQGFTGLRLNNQKSWSRPDALKYIDIPQTIKDAIKCTKLLGQRYLWVDQFCIVQHDMRKEECYPSNA